VGVYVAGHLFPGKSLKEEKRMNFFTWIREGVRQAVLYGVSDAVGDIGTPPNGEDVSQRLLEVIRTSPEQETPRLTGAPGLQKRKRLGRTLGEIQATMEKTT
jgi:hypothetical protein